MSFDIAANTSTAFDISLSSGVTVTPDTASLTLSGYSPAITTTQNVTVRPGVASLALTSYVPTVTASVNITLTPGVSSLSITTHRPIVSSSDGSTTLPYYIDSNGNIYWVINQSLGLVEKV